MYRIGDIYTVDFGQTNGSVQSGVRPAIIVSNNTGNAKSPNVIVIPLTSKIKKTNMPTHILIKSGESGLKVDSMALCENLITVSKSQLIKKVGSVCYDDMSSITTGLFIATTSLSFIDQNSINDFVQYLITFGNNLNNIAPVNAA